MTNSPTPSAREDIVAIDGPGGVGKSSVARALAASLGWLYIDTGAMYRAVTVAALRRGLSLTDENALGRLARSVRIELRPQADGDPTTWLDGEDVSREIRANDVSVATAVVADTPSVRHTLVTQQRELGQRGQVVMDGRDITTVVFPRARWKFYLDASLDERVQRRAEQLMAKDLWVDSADLTQQIMARDTRDRTRPVGPLRIAPDATVVDTTALDFDTVLQTLLAHVTAARPVAGPR